MISIFHTNCSLHDENEVDPQDVIDAISTLSPKQKLCIDLPHPGEGPDFFLNWAREELEEAGNVNDLNTRLRKYYNAAVYARGAVECLIDWYLSNRLLNFTIPAMSGVAQKLHALDAENLLGISFPLFNDIVFGPRNKGVHKFELVEEKEAKRAYELAKLTIGSCVHRVRPSEAPVFYGDLVTYSGVCQVAKKLRRENWSKIEHAFYFESIGDVGSCGVLVDRGYQDGKISILENIGNGRMISRYSRLRDKFKPDQIRGVFEHLERNKPKALQYSEEDLRHLIDVLMPDHRQPFIRTSTSFHRARQKKPAT